MIAVSPATQKGTSVSKKSFVGGALALLALAAPAPAAAAFERGPEPTLTSVRSNGSYNYSRIGIGDSQTPGFGAATVYAPTDLSQGTFGAVAIAPGWTENQSAIRWLGPRLASHGFAVITFDVTNTFVDQPVDRGFQLLRALDYLTKVSPVKDRIDPTRLAVMGHSMGGGGTLTAAKERPSLKAAIGLTPWSQDGNWPEITTPTLLVGAQFDIIAPPLLHSTPFYNTIPGTTPKMYVELKNGDHFITNKMNISAGATSVSWLKRFVDGDLRYSKYLCPTASGAPASALSALRHNCQTY